MKKVLSIHTGDIHLSDLKPIARQDEPDWELAQLRVLRWLLELSEQLNAAVVIGGDLFDRTSLSFGFLNQLWYVFRPNYHCLLGNHEQPDKNTGKSINDSVWVTGAQMGLYASHSQPSVQALSDSVRVKYGWVPATNSEDEFMESVKCVQDADVIVIHKYVWSNPSNSYTNASDSGNVKSISKLFPNAKVIFSSDNHIGFSAPEYNVYNCGALIRHTASQVDYVPQVFLLYDDFTVESIQVPIDEDFITDRHIKERKCAEEQERMFIRTLGDSKDISFSFYDNLKRRLENQPSKEYIMGKYSEVKGKEMI